MPFAQAMKTIGLYARGMGGEKKLVAWFSRRQGGDSQHMVQKTKTPWGSTGSIAMGFSMGEITLERPATSDALRPTLTTVQRLQLWNLLPLMVYETEYNGQIKKRWHIWENCRLLSYSNGETDQNSDQVVTERLVLEPQIFRSGWFVADERGNPVERELYRVPPYLSPIDNPV